MSKRDRKHEMTAAFTPAKAEVASPAVVNAPEVEPLPELPAAVHVEPEEIVRPTLAQLQLARPNGVVEVSLAAPGDARLVAGLVVYATPVQHRVELVAEHGESHLRALASDPTITVRLVS